MAEDDRNLPARTDDKRSVRLHDNGLRSGNLIDQAISRLDEDQIKALGVKAGEEALRLQARQTQQNIDYTTSKKVIEDHIDTFGMLEKGGRTTRQSVRTEVNTGAGKTTIESKSGATCFVATAAYGDWHHPEVVFLRWYRDNVLVKSAAGRAFTKFYWHVGPHMAKLVAPNPRVRSLTRGALSRLIHAIRSRHTGY